MFSRHEARGNMCERERVTIGFDFISDWLKKWRESLSFELGLINLNHSIAILDMITVSLHFYHNLYIVLNIQDLKIKLGNLRSFHCQ